jgi:hypothetical protein
MGRGHIENDYLSKKICCVSAGIFAWNVEQTGIKKGMKK